MASTFTRTQPDSENDFLAGFDQHDTRGQVYLFQVKTRDYMLENYISGVAHDGLPASSIANWLESYPRHHAHSDPVVVQKAVELGAAYRQQYVP